MAPRAISSKCRRSSKQRMGEMRRSRRALKGLPASEAISIK